MDQLKITANIISIIFDAVDTLELNIIFKNCVCNGANPGRIDDPGSSSVFSNEGSSEPLCSAVHRQGLRER